LVLQIISWLAEEERERIKKRQREGIDIALQNGTQFGRAKCGNNRCIHNWLYGVESRTDYGNRGDEKGRHETDNVL
jgi:DNA invertase Pin-like site-specific DNA recombinase